MFQGRPISLKVDVWDRIKTYMDEQAGQDRNYHNNTSAMIEEAVVFFLDAKEAEAGGGSSEGMDDMGMDLDLSGDEFTDEMSTDTEETTEEEISMDEEGEEEPVEEEEPEEEEEEEEAPKPRRKSAKKASKKRRK